MKNKLQHNIIKIYIYRFLNEFWVIAPILIPYYQANDLNPTQIFTIQAFYALSVLVMEIPSGYLADVIGRKRTILIGAIALPVGIFVYVFFPGFIFFLIAEFIISLANSMRSGADSAILYETLAALNRKSAYNEIEGKAFFFTRTGTSISAVAGGLLALISLKFPFYLNIFTALLILPVVLWIENPQKEKLQIKTNAWRDILHICHLSFKHALMRNLIFLGALMTATGVVGVWAYFLYYDSLKISIGFFGILFAVFQFFSALGSKKADGIEKKIGFKNTLFYFLFPALNFVLLSSIKSYVLIGAIFLNAFIWGNSFPLLLNQMNQLIDSKIRATVLSIANMTRSLFFVIIAVSFGKIVDTYSLSVGFLLLGIFYGLVALLVIGRILKNRKTKIDTISF